ncbi:MAG: hypothetical protein QXZ69_01855, partial [Candidatus Micrarchaeia archaeon]
SETKGNPNKLAFIDISDEWRWVFPFIIFSVDTKFVHKKIGRINKEVEMIIKNSNKSEKAKRIADLFVIPEPTTDDTTKFIISDNSLLFKYKDKRMQLKIKELLESRRSEEHSD